MLYCNKYISITGYTHKFNTAEIHSNSLTSSPYNIKTVLIKVFLAIKKMYLSFTVVQLSENNIILCFRTTVSAMDIRLLMIGLLLLLPSNKIWKRCSVGQPGGGGGGGGEF